MGWFWGKSDDHSSKDAYSQLDPSLREYLDRQSPSSDTNANPGQQPAQGPSLSTSPTTPSQQGYRTQLGLDQPGLSQDAQNAIPQERPEVPPESLFQDGRYAHLWKGYRPQAELEAAGRSDQDKLAEVVAAHNDRRAAISRAAMENCVMEQMAEKDCFSHGGWKKMMNMCREENRAFIRCYTMQAKFLSALGYLSAQQQTRQDEEKIQMHADKLYHEMLDRERKVKEAKEAGAEAPAFQPMLQRDETTQALGTDSAWSRAHDSAAARGNRFADLSSYTPERQEAIKEKLKGMSQQERELELQLITAESRAQLEYADKIQEKIEEEKRHRAERRERGKESIGDTIKRLWGWDK